MVLKRYRKIVGMGLQLGLAVLLTSGILPVKAMAQEEPAATEQAAMGMEAAQTGPVEPGNADMGRQLFTGQVSFENGGPPCISCHSASVGALGGGVLGPDLSKVYADPSKNPLLSTVWVNIPDIPTMGPIFSRHNITEEEMGNLRAFFEQQSMQEASVPPTGPFAFLGLGGFVVILIVFNIIWAGRYRNRNKGTAHDALWRNYGGKGGR